MTHKLTKAMAYLAIVLLHADRSANDLWTGRQGHWPRGDGQPRLDDDLRCERSRDRTHVNRQSGHDDDL